MSQNGNGPLQDEPLRYAPKKTRVAESRSNPTRTEQTWLEETRLDQSDGPFPSLGSLPPAAFDVVLPARGPRPAVEPPRSVSRRAGGFRGDTALAELRNKLALQPDHLDEPPVQPAYASSPVWIWSGRVVGVAVVAALGVVGYRWGASPHAPVSVQALLQQAAAVQTVFRTGRDASGSAGTGTAVATPAVVIQTVPTQPLVNALPVAYSPPGKAAVLPAPEPARTLRPLLTVGSIGALQADAVARLPISAAGAGARGVVVIGGLWPGSTLSAGQPLTPTAWQVAVDDLPVNVVPPAGFAGAMDINVELRGGDGSVERRGLRLEWFAKTPPKPAAQVSRPRVQQPGEIAQIVRRGEELMRTGDAAAARLMYQRAAEAGDATAAFRLAETYDPTLRSSGLAPDIDRAHTWYAKAKDLGAAQASERLERLADRHQ